MIYQLNLVCGRNTPLLVTYKTAKQEDEPSKKGGHKRSRLVATWKNVPWWVEW